ncbi:MAG: SDR family oxidoreductase [Myxococcaceae bacterium]|nr:SDR family oxidoreductase [Myxococcaceae bacterium]
MSAHRVRSGEVSLAAWAQGPEDAPVVLLAHGYPDTHEVWAGVAGILAARYRVLTYDVRGCGESSAPASEGGYTLEALRGDLLAVLEALAPGKPVHLVGHDWGAIQHWETATEPGTPLASFTAISGPCLDHVGHWARGLLKHPGASLEQLLKSWYVLAFQPPLLGRALWRTLGRAWPTVLRRLEGIESPALPEGFSADAQRGVGLYRQNMLQRLLKPRVRRAQCPVQLVTPLGDHFVSPHLADAAEPFVEQLWRREVEGGHWIVRTAPERVARWIAEWVDFREGGPESHALQQARVHGPRPGPLAVVTGAGSGIGRETALALAESGCRVVIADLDGAAAQRTAQLCSLVGAEATPVVVDVGDAAAMERFAAAVEREHGVPDVVINNAGIGLAGAFLDTTVADWDKVLRVNLWGVIHGSRLFGRQMVARGQGGHIVNVASMAAFTPSKMLPAYSTSKAAVLMLTECLRAELAGDGIGVSAICPGIIDTPITGATRFVGQTAAQQERSRTEAQRLYRKRNFTPRQVAARVMEAVQRDLAVVPVAPEAHGAHLLSRLSPALMRRLAKLELTPH